MSDSNTTPQWYSPRGGTATEPAPAAPPAPGTSAMPAPGQPAGGAPTAPIPQPPYGAQPPYSPTGHVPAPPQGPFGPSGPTGPQGSPSPRSGRRRTAELTAVAVLAALLSSGGTVAAVRLFPETTSTPSTTSSSTPLGRGTDTAPVVQADASAPNWTATAAAVTPSVVSITATSQQGGAQGSGVIIDAKGHVLTNNHVVSGAQKLTVTLSDGRTFDAEVRGTDPSTDLAVITISGAPSDLEPVAIGDSDALKVGDPVMAVGNPLGLSGTVTTGIVSALNRPVRTEGESSSQDPFQQSQTEPVVTNAIQTSAAINPGNSGGALVNAAGQLVGINSSIASLGSSSSGQSGNIGIGFAIPVSEATTIARQLIDSGTATHAYLGVTPKDGSASDGSGSMAGAEVTSVGDGTPAAQAGLKVGDVITAVDGERVESADSLVGHIRERSAGAQVKLTVLRDGKSTQVTATLVAKPSTDTSGNGNGNGSGNGG
ncbi:trypsin-like peptidase domain-containing protein [Oryzobacter telluris]|uniref:S1C family serine protease n=1 Tax=Oryzobacter telluris TaxID=3149179 RepID=UPI00370D4064